MNLEIWLRHRNMSTIEFTKMVGCSRPVVLKVKKNIPICPKYADKIIELTNGLVEVLIENIGRKPHV